MNMRVEKWKGNEIRFIEKDGEWWAVLKDICDALNLKTFKVSQRIPAEFMCKMLIRTDVEVPAKYKKVLITDATILSKDTCLTTKDKNKGFTYVADYSAGTITRKRHIEHTLINELGIYECLYASRKLEARQFRLWSATIIQKLRKVVGIQGYQIMALTEKDVQEHISLYLDDMFYNDETDKIMMSVTVQGGDVDQVPFDEWYEEWCRKHAD